MPELPEVETIKNQLLSFLPDQKLLKIEIKDPRIFSNPIFVTSLQKQKLKNLKRKGKWLFFLFDKNVLGLHLGLTGKLLVKSLPSPHLISVFLFENVYLYFYDIRKFGKIMIWDYTSWKKFLTSMGKDAMEITFLELKKLLSNSSQKIKAFLLDQKKISGIGNIYADEILFTAEINPHRLAFSLKSQEIKKLFKSMKIKLKEGINLKGCSIRDYRDIFNKKGRFQTRLNVYGRGGKPCLRCGNLLKEDKILQRTTTYCEFCQK